MTDQADIVFEIHPSLPGRRSERGQSFVEFSIVVVFLVTLVAGVADLGRAFFSYLSLQDAAQEGATYASAYPTWCYRTNIRVRDTIRNFSSLTVKIWVDNDKNGPLQQANGCQDEPGLCSVLTGASGKRSKGGQQNITNCPVYRSLFGTQTHLSGSIDYIYGRHFHGNGEVENPPF